MKPPFPEVVDSTIMANARACGTKVFRGYVEHWKSAGGPNVHLHAGAAFARGLEVARRKYYGEKVNAEDSVAEGLGALITAYGDFVWPEGSNKALDRMAGAFEYYFDEYPLDTSDGIPIMMPDGTLAIEFSFAEPLDIRHPVTGDPIIYCGRTDMIARYAEGNYIWDDKTASQLGASWAGQWDLRSQFTGYTWAAKRAGILINGTVVNGVSTLKTKYDKARAVTYRPEWEIDRWYKQLHKDLQRMIQQWEADDWDYNLDESCNSYGGCEFKQVCKSPSPEIWLPMYFEKRVWDPLTRTEHMLEEKNA